jgi:hypothetical protein
MPTSIRDLIEERNALREQQNYASSYKLRWRLQEQINVLDDLIDFELDSYEEERLAALVHLEKLNHGYQHP